MRRWWRRRRHALNPGNPGGGGTYTPGVFPARATLAGQCTAFNEKMFLRSWTNDFYLWFAEVPDTNPNSIADVIQYFDALKTPQLTPSMQPEGPVPFRHRYRRVDRAVAERPVDRLRRGADDHRGRSPPRRAVVAFVEPGTPASTANVTRGMEVLRINNVDFVNDNTQAGVDTLNAAFFPSSAGQTFTFVFSRRRGARPRRCS